ANVLTYMVIDQVAQNRCRDKYNPHYKDVQYIFWMGDEGARGKKQGIAWKKRSDHQTCFGKDNQEEDQVGPGFIIIYNFNQMLINVQDKIDQSVNNFHTVRLVFWYRE